MNPHLCPHRLCAFVCSLLLICTAALANEALSTEQLEAKVARLSHELQAAQQELANRGVNTSPATESPLASSAQTSPPTAPPADKITPGDLFPILEGLSIGGAMRVNYFWGDYNDDSPGNSADAAGDGTIALDTFRVNMDYEREAWQAKFEYRIYEGYNSNDSYHFAHTAWLGYNFESDDQVQVGINRVPFGPGDYGISNSWFFDQHFYVGLTDDMDLGVKYTTERGAWTFDLAYYYSSEPNGSGSTEDSSRYAYDAVDESGEGYEERNQFNARVVRHIDLAPVAIDVGLSAQYGEMESQGSQSDGDHYAVSIHPVITFNNWTLATQLTYYEYDVSANDAVADGTDRLIQMGAYDFPTTIAAEAWIAGAALSYKYETTQIGWLDYVLPYIEYSSILKEESSFNNSDLFVIGAAWARGGWYIYTDIAYSNGNDFVGNESGFDSRFGSNPDDDWETRYNINIGYYY